MLAVENDAQKTDEVDSIDDDRTDTEVRVELFDVCELRFGAEPDKLHVLLIQRKSSRCVAVFKALDKEL